MRPCSFSSPPPSSRRGQLPRLAEAEPQLELVAPVDAAVVRGVLEVAEQVGLDAAHLGAQPVGVHRDAVLALELGERLVQPRAGGRQLGRAEAALGQPGIDALQRLVHELAAHQRLGVGLQPLGAQLALDEPAHRAGAPGLQRTGRPGLALGERAQHLRVAQRAERLGLTRGVAAGGGRGAAGLARGRRFARRPARRAQAAARRSANSSGANSSTTSSTKNERTAGRPSSSPVCQLSASRSVGREAAA